MSKLAVPFPDFNEWNSRVWSVSQDCIDAIVEFQKARKDCHLSQVTVVCNSLLQADVLRVVCEQLLAVKNDDSQQNRLASETDQPLVPIVDTPKETTTPTEWHVIKEVLKRRKYKGKIQFLVKWEEDDSVSWVDRKDVTDAAIQQFISKQSKRRKVRRK